jgi:hypothetical protein
MLLAADGCLEHCTNWSTSQHNPYEMTGGQLVLVVQLEADPKNRVSRIALALANIE